MGNLKASVPLTWRTVALGSYVGAIHVVVISYLTAGYRLWHNPRDTLGLGLAAILLLLTVLPLKWTDILLRPFVLLTCQECARWFPVKVVVEDEDSLKPGRPYLIALEPHSVLPLAVPIVFATQSPLAPKAFYGNVHGMASSVCFVTPVIRQLYHALGFRSVSRATINKLLSSGRSVVLNPGGVQECLYMEQGSETLFLRKRHGFVRMAMRHGVPLVPVFVFGQTDSYNWWRPKPDALVRWISRQVGAVPLLIWGWWVTPLPNPSPMTVIVGKPLEVPHTQSPTSEQLDEYLGKFIQAMEDMVERHKAACGHKEMQVRIM